MKNKKKSINKDIHNLRQLLRENILSKSSNDKIKFSKEHSSKVNPNQRDGSLNNKKIFSFSMLKYKPKRLINFKGINIPLPTLGKASLDYSKTFGLHDTSEINQFSKTNIFDSKTIITKNKNKNKNKIELIKDDNLIEFKNIYILKYAQFSENFSKFHQNKELISDARKRDFEDFYCKISKSLESQSQLLLNYLDEDNKVNNDIYVNPYLTTSPGIQFKNKKLFDKDDNFLNNKKKILVLSASYNSYIIRFISILFKEIKEYKNEIIKLLKKNHEYELRINTHKKELEDLKNYMNKYSINKRIFEEKEKENSIKIIKNKYMHKENEYIVSMYQLQNEIHSLIKLLDKNKHYYNKFIKAENEININNKKNDAIRLKYSKELNDKNLELLIEKDKREELINQLEELNTSLKKLKEQNETQKRQEIEINAQIMKNNIRIEEKNENLMMMNEELEYYIREYDKERYNHQNTLSVLRSLENKIYNEEKEK